MGQCQTPVTIPQSTISESVESYLKQNDIGTCPLVSTQQSYYGSSSAVLAFVDCQNSTVYPGVLAFVLNGTGGILNVSAVADANMSESCGAGQVMNLYLDQCQRSVNLNQSFITNSIDGYLQTIGFPQCPVTMISDSYYGTQPTKLAVISCQNDTITPLSLSFFFNSTGNMVNVTETG
jgi:hypothetical protein